MSEITMKDAAASTEAARLIHDLRVSLEESKARHDEARMKRRAKRNLLPAPDPSTWRQQLEDLVDQGIEDITIGYWRLSSDEQQEGQGAEVQQQHVVAYMQIHGGERKEVDLWVWDTESGTTGERLGYQFIEEAARKYWQVSRVVCYKLDRFSREGGQGDVDIRALRKVGTRVVSVTESISDGPMGDLVQLLFLGIAAYEAAIILQRTSSGRKAKIKADGSWYGGILPYGYGTLGRGALEINENEAKLVRLIFRLWERGYNLKAIPEALNRWGLSPRMGKRWYPNSIAQILMNEAQYRAEAHWGTIAESSTPITHPPLLEQRGEAEERVYMYKNQTFPRLQNGARVPDDVFGEPKVIDFPTWERRFTKEQADAMVTCFSLYDGGQRVFRHLARQMDALGLKSTRGSAMHEQTVRRWVAERAYFEPKALRAGGEVVTEPLTAEECSLSRLKRARRRALELREITVRVAKASKREVKMGFGQIADTLNKEGHRTIRGALWNVFQVEDLIKGISLYARLMPNDEEKAPTAA